jgi:hypothetical protein
MARRESPRANAWGWYGIDRGLAVVRGGRGALRAGNEQAKACSTGFSWWDGLVGWGGSWFVFFGLELGNGFIWEFGPQGFETVEFFDGAAVQAFALGLIAQEQRKGIVLPSQTVEAVG